MAAADTSAMIGRTLGHYRVLEKIGAGGMGDVYRAEDLHLRRDVAIKVLPAGTLADEQARRHFRKEAEALSKLNHPNIQTVFDFDTQNGVDFLATEYVPGVTLSDRLGGKGLPKREVLRLGQQLAESLAAAHEQGIVHCDLKPSNLRVTPDGRLKVLDFGVARLVRAPSPTDTTESVTETQSIAGTPLYMAPEQKLGEPVDFRTDIYSTGLVLREMATGQGPPRPGERPPTLAGVSPPLQRIIEKCLDKDPESRYQSAKELAVDLRRVAFPTGAAIGQPSGSRHLAMGPWRFAAAAAAVAVLLVGGVVGLNVAGFRDRLLKGSAPGPIDSIAVLPLNNLMGGREQEYFADGMTEALITELSKINALKVISRTSAMQYKGVRKPMPQIAEELGVDALVEGSVLREGDQVRVAVQLIHGPSDRHLWADNFDRELRNILSLQREVAQAITREIEIAVTPAEQSRLAQTRPINPSAYDAYLKGRYHWNKRTQPGVKKALEHFQQALESDPSYALAYGGVADSYAVENGAHLGLSPKEARPRAKAAATKALELDPTLAEAHTTLADCLLYYDWDWAGAQREFKRAIELNPNYPTARQWYAELLSSLGRYDAAVAEVRRAEQLDPLSPSIATSVGLELFFARRYAEAIQQLQKVVKMDPNFEPAYGWLEIVYGVTGMEEEYVEAREKFLIHLGNPKGAAAVRKGYEKSGYRGALQESLKILHRASQRGYINPVVFARHYAALGEKDKAIAWLEKAYEERNGVLVWLKKDPALDLLRDDPRFQDLLRRMNFPP